MRFFSAKKNLRIFAALLAAAIFLCSCKGLELENKTEIVEEYTKSQSMILVANVRNRYENEYTEAIWDLTVSTDGSNFDKLIVQNVKEYLETIKLICMLADEEGISLSSSERELVRQMSEKYLSLLTDADLSYIGCDFSDVQKMYTDIFEADKLLKSITDTVDSDISDSEAKVIKIQQIVTSDEKKAKAILKRIKIDGASFSSMASRYTESDVLELTLLNDETASGLIARTAFSLEENEVSNILCVDGLYYIIMCVDDYAVDETLERKDNIKRALNSKAVQDVLGPYSEEHNIQFTERYWNTIDFTEHTESTADNFFDIYNSIAD